MPNRRINKSAKKRVLTDAKKRLKNKAIKSKMRTAIKKVLNAENKEEAVKCLKSAQIELDKAARKNVIHKNTAARKKSRLGDFIVKISQ